MSISQVEETLNPSAIVTVFPGLSRGRGWGGAGWQGCGASRENVFPVLGHTEEPKGLLYP